MVHGMQRGLRPSLIQNWTGRGGWWRAEQAGPTWQMLLYDFHQATRIPLSREKGTERRVLLLRENSPLLAGGF